MTVIVREVCLGEGSIKVLIKDSIDIKDTITQAGSRALEHRENATQNAEIIENILKHDCKVIGKTNLHELAFGITGINAYTGTPINPKYPALIPGGSSSGSAVAVAAHLCDFSIGTDTGGSIRMPATCCGVFGLKPTFARVSRQGVLPEHSSLDCVGPFAQNISQLIQAMQMIDPTFDLDTVKNTPNSELKLAVLDVAADPKIWKSIHDFLNKANVEYIGTFSSKYMAAAFDAAMKIINAENYAAFSDLIATGKLGKDVETRLKNAALTTAQDVADAEKVRQLFRDEIDELLNHVDAIILPTLPEIPPQLNNVEHNSVLLNLTALVRPFNLSGHPALSIPLETTDALPLGLQIVTHHGQDEKLCLIAQALIENVEMHQQQATSQ